jgi:cytochrome c peroxidase
MARMIFSNTLSKITLSLICSFIFYSQASFSSETETAVVQATGAFNNIRLGPGDSKVGYDSTSYTTDSRAIESRQGVTANLIRVVDNPPLGLPKIPVPANNPITKQKIELGRKLFFDRRLSINNTFSCAICHIPEQGFTNNELEKAVGVEGRSHRRNAPTIYNTAYLKRLFHDAREQSLETLVWSPLLAHNEMAMPAMGQVIEKIRHLPDYQGLFEKTFNGQQANAVTIGQAIASYNRVLVSGNSPFDRWYYAKEKGAISIPAQRGFNLFKGKAQCASCHSVGEQSALFTDNKLHNVGLGFIRSMGIEPEDETMLVAPGLYMSISKSFRDTVSLPPLADVGYYEITQNPDDRWKYRTPSLRNVALTAPYMHDGTMHSLKEVIAFYNQGGVSQNENGFPNVTQSPLIKPLGLTNQESSDLIAFLNTLNGDNIAELISDAFATPVGDTTNH